MNVGFGPVTSPGVEALTRDRSHHVDQNDVRFETLAAANTVLVDAQTEIGLAQTWGGGLVASVDGMRFVVPVRTIHARPNPKYFGRKRGINWLNMLNDQSAGLAAQVLRGTPRDSLHTIDVVLSQQGGKVPEAIITDTGSYSDIRHSSAARGDARLRPRGRHRHRALDGPPGPQPRGPPADRAGADRSGRGRAVRQRAAHLHRRGHRDGHLAAVGHGSVRRVRAGTDR